MASDRADVLLLGPLMPFVLDELGSRFHAHRFVSAADAKALPAEARARIGAIAHAPPARVDRTLIEALPNLRVVANFGVGYDTVDAEAAADRGVIVTNTPDVLNEEVADTALGLLIATVRRLPQADAYVREGRWEKAPFPFTATLRGRTVGMVGMGRIGKAIAKRVESFGLPVVYHSRRPAPDVGYRHYPDLVAMAGEVDTLVVIVPGGPGTRHMIDAAELKALGPDGVLVNVARGSVVDEEALIAALQNKEILAAGLDVFEHEPHVPAALIAMENVVLLPHVGSATHRTRHGMAKLVVDNVLAWADGAPPLTPVAETPFKGWR